MHKPISCELFDYIEIACMFGYHVRLTIRNGDTLVGKALTTQIDQDKHEQMIIQTDKTGEQRQSVDTGTIKSLDVLTPNARFRHIDFD